MSPAKRVGPEWAELAARLRDRRLDLARFTDPDFATLTRFARKRGIHYRTAADLEHGRRDNYGRGVLLEAEVAYGLAPGSVNRSLAGGQFEAAHGTPPIVPSGREPAGTVADLRPALVRDYWHDPVIGAAVRGIWTADGRYVPQEQKLAMIRRLARMLRNGGSGDIGAASGP